MTRLAESQEPRSEKSRPLPVDWEDPSPVEVKIQPPERAARFSALSHRNFRLFWFGNLISLFGTLAQQAAQSWLVRDRLTDNTVIIAVVAACGTAPFLVFTLYAGMVADRVDKRRTLIFLNAVAACLAL